MEYYDLILHLDLPDEKRLGMVLRNCANYLKALPGEKFELAVVVNGGAVKLFTQQAGERREQVQALLAQGVKFKLCANALAEHGILPADVWPGCEIVPAGLVEIVRLQRAGFAYIRP